MTPDDTTKLTFTVEETVSSVPRCQYIACLGDYDEGAALGYGDTPSAAIIDWLELHGETIDGETS